ncbi:MAG: DUF2079 domain-containing protein [Thermoplasmata archaeon]|nr:DUF2079 domain-containing protein [Thermoplasmata archaeon]
MALVAGIVAYAVLFGEFQFLNYWSFRTGAWDLGVYNQALYTTTHTGHPFYYTADLPAGNRGNLFAVHVVPSIFVLAPFYFVAPGPVTALLLEQLALALGAIPTYLLAVRQLQSRTWGLVFATAYLVVPLTQGTGWIDFNPEAFLPVTALSAIYFLTVRRKWAFVAAWLLTLGVIESIAPFLVLFAGAALLGTFWPRTNAPTADRRDERRLLAIGAALALGWLGATFAVVHTLNPTGSTFGPAYASQWAILGSSTIYNVPLVALEHPSAAAAALAFDGFAKLVFVLVALACLAFLPLVGPKRFLLPASAWLALAALSNQPTFYHLDTQYTGYLDPFLVAGAIGGAVRVRRWCDRFAIERAIRDRFPRWRPSHLRAVTIASFLVVVLTTSALASPLNPRPFAAFPRAGYGIPAVTSHAEALHELVGLVPAQASILTTNRVFPELSNRANAFEVPRIGFFVGNTSYQSVIDAYLNQSEFVLVDFVIDLHLSILLLTYGNLTGFPLMAQADDAFLFQRGWSGPPLLWTPSATVVDGGLSFVPKVVQSSRQPTGPYGPALYYAGGAPKGTQIWTNPGSAVLAPGLYVANLTFVALPAAAGLQLRLATVEFPEVGTAIPDYVTSFGHHYNLTVNVDYKDGELLNTTLFATNATNGSVVSAYLRVPFLVLEPGVVECNGFVLSPPVQVWVLGVTFQQVGPP